MDHLDSVSDSKLICNATRRRVIQEQPTPFDKKDKTKAKDIMKRNGTIMKEVMKFIEDKVMVDEFGLIDDNEEQKGTTQAMKDALVSLLEVRIEMIPMID